jgi:hypothetical protein
VLGYNAKTNRVIKTHRIVWEREPLDLTADEARLANIPTPGGDGHKMRAAPARELLREILAAGPVLRKTVVERGAEQALSFNQLC